nr:immunoglobulin heavy chain junction region [Mus musculus]
CARGGLSYYGNGYAMDYW